MIWLKLFLIQIAMASQAQSPTPFPVFLKQGFSTILEFEEPPLKVVLGDANSFQVERLERSIVIKPLAAYGTTNMFVYFKTLEPRLFVLSASEDAEPTYYKKFTRLVVPSASSKERKVKVSVLRPGLNLTRTSFDAKKDFLSVDVVIAADSKTKILPVWDLVRLESGSRAIGPTKLWSERREVMKDSRVKARFIFAKPNVTADLKNVRLIVPVKGAPKSLSLELKGSVR